MGEDLKWKKFPVLGDGHVCLADVMGTDYSIVEAARVSYGEGTLKPSDDRTLIRYLMRHRHTTPFEMAEIKLRIRVPMDCWRQWIRHRTANVNEYSTRYSIAIDSAQVTPIDQWRLQSQKNRQGSADNLTDWPADGPIDPHGMTKQLVNLYGGSTPGHYLSAKEKQLHKLSREVYEERVNVFGIAREQARKDLPLSTYTEAYWKIDLHNMFHFLSLRMDHHAQKEIREFATVIGHEIVKPLFPIAWEAFEDYRLGAVYLSRIDAEIIQRLLSTGKRPVSPDDFIEHQHDDWKRLKKCRERDECFEKLVRLKVINVDMTT